MTENYLRMFEEQCVLVTGGAGAIGSNLTRALLNSGVKRVVVLDDLSAAGQSQVPADLRVMFIHGSVLTDADLCRAFGERPGLVYHLAALFANQNSIDHPQQDLLVNGLGTLKVLQYAHLSDVERVVYASSGAAVYGKAPLPLKEDVLSIDLDTPYQITKLLGELYCNFFETHYGLKTVRARFFNSYGPGEIPGRYRNVIPNFIYWAMRGEPLPVMGTGSETRDWTYVGDVIDGLLRAGAMKEAVGEVFNLASGRETRIIDIANWVNEEVGNKAGIRRVPRRKWDSKEHRLASIDKAQSILGYRPATGLREGLRQTVEWFRRDWSEIQATAKF
jgi:UDP-glucose 4-epimerase